MSLEEYKEHFAKKKGYESWHELFKAITQFYIFLDEFTEGFHKMNSQAFYEACKNHIIAVDNKPGDDLGQRAIADAQIQMRAALNSFEKEYKEDEKNIVLL